ncbi:hypothetical protein K2X96_01165 [Patescibacteria group bacterium]|nr:hypothetical protein [Patescibacteria group bacterium]
MKKSSSIKKPTAKELQSKIKSLKSEIIETYIAQGIDEYIDVAVEKTQERFTRVRNPDGPDKGIGKYLLVIAITAKKEEVSVPISVASSKKTTGFVYHIEGTAPGFISTAEVSCQGKDVSQVTLGTILYCKIPAGKTATFRVQVEITGGISKTYRVFINRINYKLNLLDTRYRKFLPEISTKPLQFY